MYVGATEVEIYVPKYEEKHILRKRPLKRTHLHPIETNCNFKLHFNHGSFIENTLSLFLLSHTAPLISEVLVFFQ